MIGLSETPIERSRFPDYADDTIRAGLTLGGKRELEALSGPCLVYVPQYCNLKPYSGVVNQLVLPMYHL